MRRLNLWGVPKLAMKILVCPLFFIKIQLFFAYNVSLINVTECSQNDLFEVLFFELTQPVSNIFYGY